MGYLAAYGVVILLIIGIYSFGYAAKQTSLLFVLLLETIVGLVLILPLLFFVNGIGLTEIFAMPTQQNWLWLGAASVMGFVLGNYFSLMHIREAGEKLNSLLSPAITALTILLSYIFLNDKLAALQWLGTLIALFTIVLFLLKQSNLQAQEQKSKGILSGLATVICISFTIICTIKGVGNLPFLLAIWLRLFVAFIILLPVFILTYKNKYRLPVNYLFYVAIFLGVLAQTIGAAYLWLYASFKISVSVFQIIVATLPLVMYAIDVYIFKKSKPSVFFLVTAVVAAVGIALAML
ncbi:MAG: DMT family transporter [Deinococcales bacterium]|nr:DMT family transporter [Chitinophagaceae bacterium]